MGGREREREKEEEEEEEEEELEEELLSTKSGWTRRARQERGVPLRSSAPGASRPPSSGIPDLLGSALAGRENQNWGHVLNSDDLTRDVGIFWAS